VTTRMYQKISQGPTLPRRKQATKATCNRKLDANPLGRVYRIGMVRAFLRVEFTLSTKTHVRDLVRNLRRLAQCYRLPALRAAPCINGNLAQAFRTLLGRWICRCRRLAHPRDQGIDRRDYKEIYSRGDQ
jgi:hypothetical protein